MKKKRKGPHVPLSPPQVKICPACGAKKEARLVSKDGSVELILCSCNHLNVKLLEHQRKLIHEILETYRV